jgi:hypothetical protein
MPEHVKWQNAFQNVRTVVKSPMYLQHSSRQFVRMYQRGSYWMDFRETESEDFYENLSRKSKEESNTLHEEVKYLSLLPRQ